MVHFSLPENGIPGSMHLTMQPVKSAFWKAKRLAGLCIALSIGSRLTRMCWPSW